MSLQRSTDVEFLEKVAAGQRVHLEKLTGMLDEFLTGGFEDYGELLKADIQEQLKRLQEEADRKIKAYRTYDEICAQAASWEITGFVNEKADGFYAMLREKKKVCADAVCRLLLGPDKDCSVMEEKAKRAKFRIRAMRGPGEAEREELEKLRERKVGLDNEIAGIEREKDEAENAFRELVRRNAEDRARMESEKPGIKYVTRKVRREGFFGLLADLFMKLKTETIADDSELCGWQERVDAAQREYDAQAREGNDRIEELKKRWREKEEEYDLLDTEQRQMEKKFLERMQKEFLEELETFLYGEDGVLERAMASVECDMRLNAENARTVVWREYQGRTVGRGARF